MLTNLLFFLTFLVTINESINQSNAAVTFTPRTLSAAWSPRWDSNMEFYNHPMNVVLMNGTSRTWKTALVLQGDGDDGGSKPTNDIWASADSGATWHLIGGMSRTGQAFERFAFSSFTEVYSRAATGIDNAGSIYRIGGRRSDGIRPQGAIWRSADGGQTWQDQSSTPGAAAFFPPRDRASIITDSKNQLYVVGGQIRNDGTLMTNTVFMSSDLGIHWTALPPTPWGNPRGSALLLNHFSQHLNVDVLTYLTGWDGSGGQRGLYNEIWTSANSGNSWSRIRTNWGAGLPPFSRRDAANGEITSRGIIVLVGGQHVRADGTGEALNDIWASLDGGYQWGLCNEDAPFADRRDLLTAMDAQGYLYVAGGWDQATNVKFNDVWRSSISFDSPIVVSRECGLPMPACGPGLACLPGDSKTTFLSNGTVTCPRVRQCAGQSEHYVDFDPVTPNAEWSSRYWLNAEYLDKTITYRTTAGIQRNVRGPLIVHGGDINTNDVWASSDRGKKWELIAGTGAYGAQASNSYSPARTFATSIVNPVTNDIIRVGGFVSGSVTSNDVWTTTDAITWRKQLATGLPARAHPSLIVDEAGKLFFSGGVLTDGTTGKDLWSSLDNGATWSLINETLPWTTTIGRAKGFLLADRVPQVGNKDILFAGAGWDSRLFYNDIWASSDSGSSWTLITARAPFPARDAFAAEITTDGLIIVSGGEAGGSQQNDVWVSADGGYTWGACSQEALWSDRREPTGVIDGDGYFYIMGGRQNAEAGAPTFNDVFRSTLSMNDYNAVAAACNVKISKCGPGLICWPGAPGTVFSSTGVTCPYMEQCVAPTPRSSSTGRRVISSSSGKKPTPPPVDPECEEDPCLYFCDPDPDNNPECFFSSSSTGAAITTGSGLSMGVIVAIVALILAAVLGGGYWYYKRRSSTDQLSPSNMTEMGKASAQTNNSINQSLLSDDHPSSSSGAPAAF